MGAEQLCGLKPPEGPCLAHETPLVFGKVGLVGPRQVVDRVEDRHSSTLEPEGVLDYLLVAGVDEDALTINSAQRELHRQITRGENEDLSAAVCVRARGQKASTEY
jgi:hypothetical protein